MNMKKAIILILLAAAASASCTRIKSDNPNLTAQKYFDAWAQVNIPEASRTELGSYIIDEKDGDGAAIGDESFIRVDYTIRSLDGTITGSTSEQIAKQIRTYSKSNYYGPRIWFRGSNYLYAGIEELIKGKHIGYQVKAAIPGWLITSERYDTKEEYVKNVSGTNYIYEFTVVDVFEDVTKFELDSLVSYVHHNYPKVNTADTTSHKVNKNGLYYVQLKAPVIKQPSDTAFAEGDKVKFNYTGMLLNGTVFDTTIKTTAKDSDIYSSDKTYEPTYMIWKEDYTEMTMGENSTKTIDGFAYALHKMLPGEKGIVMFTSDYGYSYDGAGNNIPPYSPLAFLLEVEESE